MQTVNHANLPGQIDALNHVSKLLVKPIRDTKNFE